ncbi:MAG: hypothetical protein U0841_27565 [Chloroflexia bacterium]
MAAALRATGGRWSVPLVSLRSPALVLPLIARRVGVAGQDTGRRWRRWRMRYGNG